MISGKISIACVQANPTVGDVAGNLAIVRRERERFRGKADLLVFSECFVTGYPLGDLVMRPAFLRDVREAVGGFAREIAGDGGPAVLLGAPREGGPRPFNSAFLIETDGTIQVSDKARLPNEEVYDEKRTFAEGPLPRPLAFRGLKLGVAICEDFWHGEVTRALADEGADLLIVINGSHFKIGKQGVRLRLARDTVHRLGIPLAYVNQVGGQDELAFDGGTFAMARSGNLLAQASFQEAALLFDVAVGDSGADFQVSLDDMISNSTLSNSYPADWREAAWLAMATCGRDYVLKSGFGGKGVVIGMSGGLDSALTAAIATDALGSGKVLLVRMPYVYTDDESMDDAAEAARMLGARIVTVPIAPIVEAMKAVMAPLFGTEGKTAEDVTEENFQARARGMVLMAISNKLGYMVLTTGNKSEMSVGFATLYGDMCGGFSLIKDCPKTMVVKLARWRNASRPARCLGPDGPVMPERIISKRPSAQLAPGQTDEAVLGSYWHLDPVLLHLVDGMSPPERAAVLATRDARDEARQEAALIGDHAERERALADAELITVTADYAERIGGLVRRAQYKRRQAPPGVVLTGRDFGLGWRFPIAGKYKL